MSLATRTTVNLLLPSLCIPTTCIFKTDHFVRLALLRAVSIMANADNYLLSMQQRLPF